MNILIALLIASSGTIKYRPGEIIVKFKKEARPCLAQIEEAYYGYVLTKRTQKTGINEFDLLNEKLGAKEVERLIKGVITEDAKKFGLDLLYIVKFEDKNIDALKYADIYEKLPIIEYAEPNYAMKVEFDVNDPYFGPDYWTEQWYLFKIQAPEAWDITQGDSTIVIGPVDTGVDWQHPDIFPNLWVNPGEDLNGNGVFDYPDDLNGIDDDGDGYIDDIIGFDFMSYDWNPYPDEPGNDHGTHTFGIQAAATNNGIGIAGVGFKTRGIAFKCGDADYVYISDAINAIYFAANHGVAVTSHSYGSYNYNYSEYQAIQYAVNHGVVVVASTGNDNTTQLHYPSAFPNVIAVAATNFDDTKADFSNYGTYVDICAPGVNIMSTIPNGGYTMYDGTSMSAPVVSGAVALIKALHPTWTVAQIDSALLWGCDDIYDVNPGYVGLLGRGRLNIYKSLSLTLYPYLHIVDYHFDGDGRPEPGETVKLFVEVTNELHWQDASSVTLNLSTDDPDIAILDSIISLGTVTNGDTISPSTDYFEFQVSGETRFTELYVIYSSTPENFIQAETLHILIGYPVVVIVNDDSDGNTVDFYTSTLDNLGVVYEVWNADEGLPESFLAHDRDLIIWLTGNDSTEVLSPDEIDSLEVYLTNGGGLFISSQYLAEDPDAQSFIQDYLKTSIVETGVPRKVLRSYDGNPLGDSIYMRLYGAGGAANCISPDHISALSGADSILYYTGMSGTGNYGTGAVAYNSGTYKTLYFAFPFEAISGISNTNTREEVMGMILNWFGITSVNERRKPAPYTVEGVRVLPTVTSDKFILEFELPEDARVNIKIYDVTGRMVSTILSGKITRGYHRLSLSAKGLKPGLYFISFDGTNILPKKILVVR